MAKSTIATAYVQVRPSMDGVAAEVRKQYDPAGTKAGASFGANMIGALKKTIVVAAVGKVFKESLTAGGALEQSLGGIKTLFGEDAAQDVIANAQNAYKTAGLSANAYMETVTGFSASLLNSLDGNATEAASKADMAIRDMSDNANKMGTSMDSIMAAYQGFAKQNYTMLDNLKLGYGGTKTEMQRLLADAQKLTGVKYDINNLSDVYSAIHAIQDKLNITNATAEEATTTLIGSFNAMRSAFTDVLGGMALGMDISPALNALGESAAVFLTNNLLPAIGNIICALPGAIITFLMAAIPQIFDNAEALFQSLDWNAIGDDIINGIVQGIKSGGGKLLSALKEAALSSLDSVKEELGIQSPSRVFRDEVGKQISAGMALGISDNSKLVSSAVDNLSSSALGTKLRVGGNNGGVVGGRAVSVVQYIYSEAKTAADLMQEAMYQQEKAVLLGV